MSERNKLIDEYGSASGHVLDIGLIEYLGYRLAATEGPEFEAALSRAVAAYFVEQNTLEDRMRSALRAAIGGSHGA